MWWLDAGEKAEVVSHLNRLHQLISDLERAVATTAERANIRDRMRREIDATKKALRLVGTHDHG